MTALSHSRVSWNEEEPSPVAVDEEQSPGQREPGLRLLQEMELAEDEMAAKDAQETNHDPRELIATLYTQLRPQLYSYINGTMNVDTDQTKEIIQETFLRLTTQLLDGGRLQNPRGWVVRVARNLAIDVHRRQSHRSLDSDDDRSRGAMEPIDPSLGQEASLLKAEQMDCMEHALEKMNARHRECFLMRAQGFPLKDIAAAMNMSEPRVTEIMKKVIARLAVICG